jgi:hypothetical protein
MQPRRHTQLFEAREDRLEAKIVQHALHVE